MKILCPFSRKECTEICPLWINRNNYDEEICNCSIAVIGLELNDIRKQEEKNEINRVKK